MTCRAAVERGAASLPERLARAEFSGIDAAIRSDALDDRAFVEARIAAAIRTALDAAAQVARSLDDEACGCGRCKAAREIAAAIEALK